MTGAVRGNAEPVQVVQPKDVDSTPDIDVRDSDTRRAEVMSRRRSRRSLLAGVAGDRTTLG